VEDERDLLARRRRRLEQELEELRQEMHRSQT
jgi:hypothetical protein